MRIFLLGALLLLTKGETQTPTPAVVSSGINFFSVKQDGEIGLELSREAERVLPLVADGNATRYLYYIGQHFRRSLPGVADLLRLAVERCIKSGDLEHVAKLDGLRRGRARHSLCLRIAQIRGKHDL